MIEFTPFWIYICWKEKRPLKEWIRGSGALLTFMWSSLLLMLIAMAIIPSREERDDAEADRVAIKMGRPVAPHHYSWPSDTFKAIFEKQSSK
jgi:hypothetical protein